MKYKKNVWALILLLGGGLFFSSCSSSKSSRDYTINKSKSRTSYNSSSKTRASKKKKVASVDRSRSTSKTTSRSRNTTSSSELSVRNQIVGYAQKQKGVEYNFGGKTPRSGFDCSGLTYYIFRHYGLPLPAGSRNQAKVGRAIKINSARPGDLMFFGNSKGVVNHVALITGMYKDKVMILHSTSSLGVIEEDFNASKYWRKRYLFTRSVSSELNDKKVAAR